MELQVNEREALLIVTALGADCVTIGDEEERRIEWGIALGEEISALRERLKADTGINDERVNPQDDEEAGVSETQG